MRVTRLTGVKPAVRSRLAAAGLLDRRSYALHFLDKKLALHIKKRNGFFVEAGGNDGVSQSNTLYFERYMGWKGLLIEPVPKLAALCQLNRPRCRVVQAALVDADCDQPEVEMTYCNLMSIVNGARGSAEADDLHLRAGSRYLANSDSIESLTVPAQQLSQLLSQHGDPHIDLLSLDVEGFEAQALRGLDLDRHAPDWILVEANDRSQVEAALRGRYTVHDYLSFHDILYRRV